MSLVLGVPKTKGLGLASLASVDAVVWVGVDPKVDDPNEKTGPLLVLGVSPPVVLFGTNLKLCPPVVKLKALLVSLSLLGGANTNALEDEAGAAVLTGGLKTKP